MPVASRIRTRLVLDAEPPDVLGTMLRHLLASSGNAALMTEELQRTVCEHAAGNRRVLRLTSGAGPAGAVGAARA